MNAPPALGCLSPLSAAVNSDDASPSLLELARAGDVEAYGDLCRNYETPLMRHATRLCGDGTLAEDLAQETLVEGWKSLPRYNGQCRFFTWLCAILLNRYRNMLRRRQPWPFSVLFSKETVARAAMSSVGDSPLPPDEATAVSEQAALVWRCVEALPPKQRQVVFLRFYVDDSLEGVAEAMGCSVGTVKSRLFHALEKLRRMKELAREKAQGNS